MNQKTGRLALWLWGFPARATFSLFAPGPTARFRPRRRIYRGLLVGVVLAAAWLLPAGTARANNPIVTTNADSGPGSLREAISAINPNTGGTINFDPSVTGTITLTSGELDLAYGMTIAGPGAMNLTVSGNGASRVFNIAAGATVTISGLSIASGVNQGASGAGTANGNGAPARGGGIFNAGNLALVNCTVTQNQAIGGDSAPNYADSGYGAGGGIYSEGVLAVTNCTLSFNSASSGDAGGQVGAAEGGGIYFGSGALVNCTIASNSVSGGSSEFGNGGDCHGGGLYVVDTGIPNEVTLLSCTISGNNSTGGDSPFGGFAGGGWGGGIDIDGNASPVVQNTLVSGNSLVAGMANEDNSFIPVLLTGTNVYGSVFSGGFNLIGQSDGSSGWIASGNGADLLGTTAALDPLLGQLQNNGGPTPTMALAASSAAVDQGYSFGLTTDQRGLQRPYNFLGQSYPPGGDGSDIGAFELLPSSPVLNLAKFSNYNLSFLNVFWNGDQITVVGGISGNNINVFAPRFGVEVSPDPMFSHALPFALPVRGMNSMYLARDTVANQGAFYRLSTAVTNTFILPAATTAATAISSNAATLNGTTTPYGFNTAYWFEYGPDTNYGTCTLTNFSLATSTNLASLSCAIGGLTPSTAVHFQLVVTDDDGTQLGGDQVFTTLSAAPPPPPPTVVSYAATSVGYTNTTLNGSVNGNGLPVGAWFEYGLDTSYGNSTYNNQFFTSSDYYAAQAYSTPITGLTPNTTYHYRAIASSLAGQGLGADTTFTTAALPAPPTVATLAASSVVRSSATLNGTVNPNGSSCTVYFRYGTTTSYGDTTTPTEVDSAGSFNASITGLTANTTYHFQIVATNGGGSSYGVDSSFATLGD